MTERPTAVIQVGIVHAISRVPCSRICVFISTRRSAIDVRSSVRISAIRALAFTGEKRVLRSVVYKNQGSEELGSVYESLLELHPQLNVEAAAFELAFSAGSERKTSGSHYTPASLVNSLLDTALEPVVADRLAQARARWQEEDGKNRGADC